MTSRAVEVHGAVDFAHTFLRCGGQPPTDARDAVGSDSRRVPSRKRLRIFRRYGYAPNPMRSRADAAQRHVQSRRSGRCGTAREGEGYSGCVRQNRSVSMACMFGAHSEKITRGRTIVRTWSGMMSLVGALVAFVGVNFARGNQYRNWRRDLREQVLPRANSPGNAEDSHGQAVAAL